MLNINQTLQALQVEVEKNNMKNSLFTNNDFPQIHSELNSNRLACELSDEELLSANVTIERIEIDKEISTYVITAKHQYSALEGTNSSLEWMLLNGTSDEAFANFFSNAQVFENEKYWQVMNLITEKGLSDMLQKYVDRQALTEKETLHKDARIKVRQAIDLRDYYINTLKLFGYSFAETGAVMEG